MLKKLEPITGSVEHGTRLEVAYFDQLRLKLKEDLSIQENVAEGSDFIEIGGKKRHIIAYLQDFLFTPQRARTPVSALSGGERNRLLLAKIFSKPSNLLVLDEPTNDLDLETLELLEDLLINYTGTLLLVSHDREFLDNVVTSTIVFEGDGKLSEYIGGYNDWLRQKPKVSAKCPTEKKSSNVINDEKPKVKKLSFKEQRKLELIPKQIEVLEEESSRLQGEMADPEFYKQDQSVIKLSQTRFSKIEEELLGLYDQWEKLLD
jgi:ATP-binding cassette subfamily F protein uup